MFDSGVGTIYCVALLSPRPVLLILDGHASQVSIEAIEFVKKNDIHMLCIPAHTTYTPAP